MKVILYEKNLLKDLINKRKQLNILPDEDFKIVNMDETPCFLEMGFDTTIDFIGNSNI